MLKSIVKFYLLDWIRWGICAYKNKKCFPSVKISHHSYVRNSVMEEYVTIYDHVDITNSQIGRCTYISPRTIINDCAIGRFCSIGPNVTIGYGIHPTHTFVSTHPAFFSTRGQAQITFVKSSHFEEKRKIHIGNDVWIGANVYICDGVTIGDGAVIGAGAVVNKDVPPFAVWGGVPGRMLRYRFSEKQIEVLLRDKWWEKSLEWLGRNCKKMQNVDTYIEALGS